MKSKKTMIICLVAVLALAMMGFGFAKWSDSVKFEGSVETGNIGVNIQGNGTNDQGADPQKFPGNNKEGKDVASCDLTTTCDEKTSNLYHQNFIHNHLIHEGLPSTSFHWAKSNLSVHSLLAFCGAI
jgi:hypothetical protein